MPLIRRFRAPRRAVIAGVLAGCVSACATRLPEPLTPIAPVASTTIWRLEPGDIVHTRVFRNTDLNADPIVGPNGTAFFPGLGRVPIVGLRIDSLETMLNARYGQLVREPAVQVTMERDVTLYGLVRAPGVFAADPEMTLQAFAAKAGAQSGGTTTMTLETVDGRRLLLPREARMGRLDLHRDDAVRFDEQSFFVRNASIITATQIAVTTLSTVIGLVLILTR